MKRVILLATTIAIGVAMWSAAGAQPRGFAPPPGDYWQACRNLTAGPGAVLTGECRDETGRWRPSSVQFGGCDRIDVRDGLMGCSGGYDRDRYRDRDRGVGYGSKLTLYSGPDFTGEAFQTRDEVTNLPKRYNDQALSLRIEGRGAWTVCADSDFGGRCQVFDHDVRDLRALGLGYAITSMRPAR